MYKVDNKKNLFVVDDDFELQQVLLDELSPQYNYYFSYDGSSAQNKLDMSPLPHLIITRDMMKDFNGFEFYQRLLQNKNYAGIPLIFITGELVDLRKFQGLQLGAVDYICSPFSVKELKLKINSIINLVEFQKTKIFDFYLDFRNSLSSKYNISCREKDILQLIEQGKEYKEIANILGISLNTVATYVKRIFKKCHVVNKLELINLFTIKQEKFWFLE